MSEGSVVTLTLDDKACAGRSDESILDVARENGLDIPTMCYLEGLSEWGACRLCLVEIEGSPKLVPACTTRVAEGMVVRTDTERLRNYRKMIVEMMFAERNHVCSVCVSNGACELESMAVPPRSDPLHPVRARRPRM